MWKLSEDLSMVVLMPDKNMPQGTLRGNGEKGKETELKILA